MKLLKYTLLLITLFISLPALAQPISINEAINKVTQVPEVKTWLKNFHGKTYTNKNTQSTAHIALVEEDTTTDTYTISVYEDFKERRLNFATYKVDRHTGQLKKD